MANAYTMAGDIASMTQCTHAAAVTPHDDNDLTEDARVLYIGTGGDLKVDTSGGDTVTLSGLPDAAKVDWLIVRRVYATGTEASNITAYW